MATVFDSENQYIINQNIGIGGQDPPSAKIHIGPSNGRSSSSPLKLTPGTNLVVPENGSIEYDGSHLYITISGIRYQLDQQGGGGGVAWGNILGTLSNQTDLQNALNAKVNKSGDTLSGILNMGSNKITSLATPTISTDAATKGYVDSQASAVWGNITGTLSNQTDLQTALNGKQDTIVAGTTLQYYRGDKTFHTLDTSIVPENTNLYYTDARVRANRLDQLTAPNTALSINSQKLINVSDPTSSQDAATKNYVDGKFPLSISNGGTNNSSAYTSGSLIYSDGSKLTQDNSHLFYDSTNKFLGIGTNAPEAALDVANDDILMRSDATNVPSFILAKSKGTLTSPTIITGGSQSQISFQGYTGSGFYEQASITLQVPSAAISSTSMPADLLFYTTRRLSLSERSSLELHSDGTSAIGSGASDPILSSNFGIWQDSQGVGQVTTNGTTSLVGTETKFTNTFKPGDTITVQGETIRIVSTIADDTHLTVTSSFSTTANNLTYTVGNNGEKFSFKGNGNLGIGITSPTALIHLKAGIANPQGSPLKFTTGTNLTTPESGAVEWDGTNLYITQAAGPTRKTIAYTDSIVDSLIAGSGISISGSTGNVTVTNTGVTALTGTTNQVNVSASAGSVTLSLPQNIHTAAIPQFAGLGLGLSSPQSTLHIKAGSASANTAPLQFNSGVLETSPRAGVVEFLNDAFYGTITTGPTRGIFGLYRLGRSTGQTAAVANVTSYTLSSSDASFIVSANVNVTTFSVGTFNVTVSYTDETNTSRTLTLNFSSITGTLGIAIAAAGAFEGIPLHIRCKASTSITIATTGTFTSLTYNVEGSITQIS